MQAKFKFKPLKATENVYYTHCAELGKNSLSLKMYRVSQLSVDLEINGI